MLVGQPDFSSTIPGPEAFQLGTPLGLAVAGNKLILADGGYLFTVPNNNRVLIFNDITSGFQGPPASVVIGQANFGFNCGTDSKQSCTAAAAGANGLNTPIGVTTDGTRLVIADSANNRVLIFNKIPTANNASADVVLGQPDFNTTKAGTANNSFRQPNGVFLFGGKLFIADTLNHRVLIYNTVPTSNNAAADVVLGQPDFTSRKILDVPNASSLQSPVAVTTDGTRLIVTDLGNNRILIYKSIPTSSGAAADYVVGQPDFATTAVGAQAGDLNYPRYAYSDGSRLYIADSGNNRIMVFNEIPSWNNATAEVVLGQPGFGNANEGTASERTALPVSLAPSASGGILVSDANNRRVLEFKTGLPIVARGGVVDSASLNGNGLDQPTNLTATSDTGGSIPAGTYYLKVTASSNFPRESTPSDEISITVPDSSKITANWNPVNGVTSYRLYLGTSSGGQSRFYSTGVANAVAPKFTFAGTPIVGDVATYTITKSDATTFTGTYTVQQGDDLIKISNNVAAQINGNTGNDLHGVIATANGIDSINFKSKEVGTLGTNCKYTITSTGGLTSSPNTVQSFTAPDAGSNAPQPTITFDHLDAAPSTDFGFDFQAPYNQVVPGSIASVFGQNLAPGTFRAADFAPLPTEVEGVSVLVNGRMAPLAFVSPSQINFQVPLEITGSSISVQVRQFSGNQASLSVAIPVNLTFPQPSIYSLNGAGTGPVLAQHLDGTLVDNDHPAKLGETVSVYGTGYGLMLDSPSNVQLTITDTGGGVIPATYFLRVTTIFPDGRESLGSGESQITISTGGTSTIQMTWDAVTGASGYRVYLGGRSLGYDRYYETSTNSFTVTSIYGTQGVPPAQTNVPGDGKLGVATTLAALMVDQNMPVVFQGPAPGKVGIFRTDLTVSLGITRESQSLTPDQAVGFPEMRLVVGAIESNHVLLPVSLPALNLLVDPPALSFIAFLGGGNPGSQNVTIYQTGGGSVNWTSTIATTDGGSWLSISPFLGTDLTTTAINVDVTSLKAGTYTGTVTITGDVAANAPQVVKVTLVVNPALQATPTSLSFVANAGSNPASQAIALSKPAQNTTTVNWTAVAASTGGKWLSIDSLSGADTGTINASVDTTGLKAGTYSGAVTITTDYPGDSPLIVPVTLVVSPSLTIGPTQLNYSAFVGGASPVGQNIIVTKSSTNTTTVNWKAVAATNTGGNWLFISPAAGTDSGSVGVSILIGGLAVGTYTGTVTISTDFSADVAQVVPITLVINPALQFTPSAMSFNANVGGAFPPGQNLNVVKASATATPIHWNAVPSSTGNWLSVSPGSGTDSGTAGIFANPAGLAVGTYTGQIALVSDFPGDKTQNVPVTLVINPALQLFPSALSYSASLGDANPAARTITISNPGGANWTAAASSAGNWLSVTPVAGSGQGSLSVAVNLAGLTVGTYTGKITVTSNAAGDVPQTTAVTLVLGPSLQLSRTTVAFSSNFGDTNPTAQTVAISKSSAGTVTANWKAAASSTGNWLSVAPVSGSGAGTLQLSVDITSLAIGTYTGKITLTTDVPGDPAQTITVTATVKPVLNVTPASLIFQAPVGGSNPATQTIGIAKSGSNSATISWTATASAGTGNWLSVSPASGTDAGSLVVTVDITGLAVGTYSGKIVIATTVAGDQAQTVTVNLTVAAASASVR